MLHPGEVVADRFEVKRAVSAGGMGDVYCALDRTTNELVALKLLGSRGAAAERFELEARTLAGLEHPAIVRYVAHGELPGRDRYLVMEWLEGEDLADRLLRKGLTVSETLVLARRVAEALAVLHARGVVHRDVKPANLFLVGRRVEGVKLIDFGIVHADRSGRLTRSGDTIGTPAYMAPEQARGDISVTAAADVFALGCVLWECLVGRPLFAARSVLAVMARVVFAETPLVREARPELAPSLDRLLLAMLAKEPGKRLADGGEIVTALARLDLDASTGAAPVPVPPSGLTASERRLVSIVLAQPSPTRQTEAAGRLTLRVRSSGRGRSEPPAGGPNDLTHVADASAERLRALWTAAEKHGATMQPLHDGSVAAMLVSTGWASDLAVRAARCALAMREALPDAAMALATCRAVVANRLPLGEVIDTAAALLRAERKPEGGRLPVRIDEMSAGFLDERFEVVGDELGLALRAERPPATEGRRLLGKVTPCVGRERENATLDALVDECIGEPVARTVLVTGPAGIGKSRLRHELVRKLRNAAVPVEIWTAHGDAMSAGAPFGLLAQALRQTAGLREGEAASVRAAKMRARVSRHVPVLQQQRIATLLGELVGAPPLDTVTRDRAGRRDAIVTGDQMRRAFEDFVKHEARVQPLILVLEDLQWGDLPSIRFVDAALRAAHDLPFFVMAVGRPEVHELYPTLFAERGLQELRIGELSRRAAERLAREALGDVAPEVIERVVDQASGNPLYLEELVRAVADGREELPPTVLAMVQTRLEALPAETRRLLRAASVYGRTFWRGGAAALLGNDVAPADVREHLDVLVERELIRRRQQSRFRGEDEYVFRHATLRDAAYAMLTEADRRLGHKLAAGWLERMGETEPLGLGDHFERGGEPARAVRLYRRSAEQALEGNDLEAAVARAERGVSCGASGVELGSLRLIQAEARGWAGDAVGRGVYAAEAVALLPKGSARWFRASAERAAAARITGERGALVSMCRSLVDTAPLEPVAAGPRSLALARTTAEALAFGDTALADELLVAADGGAEDDPSVTGHLFLARALAARLAGDPIAALAAAERSAQSFVFVGDLRFACLDWTIVGILLSDLGQQADAEAILRDMLADAQRMGWPRVGGAAELGLVAVLLRGGAWDEARDLAAAAAESGARQGDARSEGLARHGLARALLGAGKLDEAETEARAAIRLARTAPLVLSPAHATLAAVLAARGDSTEARRHAELAWEARRCAEDRSWVALICADVLGDEVAVAARRELQERADAIDNVTLRRGFLEKVPENARLLTVGLPR